VLIDEAQDTNAARRGLALKLLKRGTGRLIAVGDDRQAIYGFTGADADAMNQLREALGSATLPLNVTYRCPKNIVREAQRLVPDITAHPTAPEGAVSQIALGAPVEWRVDDAVLCRNTAPLIEMAYQLIGARVPCRVEGRDIGKSLETLVRRWKVKTLIALEAKLSDYLARETAKWLDKNREDRAQAVADKVASIQALIQVCQREQKHNVIDLVELISTMFGDTAVGERPQMLTLSTVHKSKGREWPRVFVLRKAELMPSPWARQPWQQQQEMNLIYVAITRAQRELVYLG
jgi:superfamily I DNA/RNA helicase